MDIPIAFIDLENRDLEIELPVAIEIDYYIEIIPQIIERPINQEVSLNPLIWHCWCCILCIIFFVLIIYILIGIKIVT